MTFRSTRDHLSRGAALRDGTTRPEPRGRQPGAPRQVRPDAHAELQGDVHPRDRRAAAHPRCSGRRSVGRPLPALQSRTDPGTEGLGDILRLIFAVAGFAPEQLEISVAGDQLSISGEQNGDADPQRYLHRGIASRRFRRFFLSGRTSWRRARNPREWVAVDRSPRTWSGSGVAGPSRSGCGTVESAAPGRCLRDRNA